MENERFQELVLQQLHTLTEGQIRLESKFGNMESKVDNLENVVEDLKTTAAGLEDKFVNLETKFDNLEDKVDGLGAEVSDLKNKVGNLETKVVSVDNKVNSLEVKVDKLEIRMENEVIDKIRALFDARDAHLDHFNNLREGQERIEKKLDLLIDKAITHDSILERHEREIRLLRSRR